MSVAVTFTPNKPGIDRLLHSPVGPTGIYVTRLGNQIVNGAKQRANVDTGLMRSRIEFRLIIEQGRIVGIVEARTNYSVYVHAINPFLTDAARAVLG